MASVRIFLLCQKKAPSVNAHCRGANPSIQTNFKSIFMNVPKIETGMIWSSACFEEKFICATSFNVKADQCG
jgi:hypothetical protein